MTAGIENVEEVKARIGSKGGILSIPLQSRLLQLISVRFNQSAT